jgi:mannosyltransferase
VSSTDISGPEVEIVVPELRSTNVGRCHYLAVLLGVWLLSIGVVGWNSWLPAWSGDEAATVTVVRRTVTQVLRTFHHDPALVPYYAALKMWSLGGATSEFWLRLPSVLAMSTAVAAIWVLAVRLGGQHVGAFAVLVMLALPATSRYGQEVRPFALSLLLVVFAVSVWEDDGFLLRRRRQAEFAGLVLLAGAAHPYALLVVPVLITASTLAPREDRRREVVVTAASGAAGVLLLSPFLLRVAWGAHGQPDPPPVTAANVTEEFLRLPVGVLSPPFAAPLAVAALGLAAAGFVVGWRRGGCPRRGAALSAAWLLLPPLVLCAFQLVTASPGLVARYWVFSLGAIAITTAFALDAIWFRRRGLAVLCGLVLVALSVPTHLTIRTVDGHLGQRWRDLPPVLDFPVLREANLLANGWSYRALVSNDPSIASRMPLVIDPAPSGRVNPEFASTDSEAFRLMSGDDDAILVLQAEQGFLRDLPTRRSFRSFREEVRAFPTTDVLCTYFGEPLGVFSKTPSTVSNADARMLAEGISAIEPGSVHCRAPDNG